MHADRTTRIMLLLLAVLLIAAGLAATIRSAVTGIDGVRGASVKVKRRKIKVAATGAAQDKAAARILRDPVLAAARQRLTALKLRRAPSVSVRVTPRGR